MMIDIWQEKIAKHNIVRTGSLMSSFSGTSTADSTLIKWAGYGIYQAFGTGRGYARGNGGDLQILDNTYRDEHGLNKRRRVGPKPGGYLTSGKPRQRRDWISKKLFLSVMNLRDDLARIVGEESALVIADALTDLRDAIK